MPETGPETVDLFDRYCGLLADRKVLQETLASGSLVEESVAQTYREVLGEVNAGLDELMVSDGFVDSVLHGGNRAAGALEQLASPVLARAKTTEQLAAIRAPYEERLEVAASFLAEFCVADPRALRIKTAAAAIGIQVVSTAAFLRSPEKVDAEPVEEVTPQPEVSVDVFFSTRDAGLLVSSLLRFKDVLADNGIVLDGSLAGRVSAAASATTEQCTSDTLRQDRIDALSRLGVLLQDPERVSSAISSMETDDPRRELLIYLRSVISEDTYSLFCDLIEANKAIQVTLVTPRRSGPHVEEVTSRVVRSSVRPQVTLKGQALTPAPAVERQEAAKVIWPNIDSITEHLTEEGKALAQVCLGLLMDIRPLVQDSGIKLDNEGYKISFISSLLCMARLPSAVQKARADKVLSSRLSRTNLVTLGETLLASLHSRSLLRKFVAENSKVVSGIVERVFE